MKPLQAVLLSVVSSAVTSLVMYLVVGGTLPAPTDVPSLVGLNIEQSRKLCDAANLLLVFEGERVPESDQIPPGTVLQQKPLGGSRVRTGEFIYATLSAAPQKTHVPVLEKLTIDAAKTTLEESGLHLGRVTEVTSQTVPTGQIIDSRPAAGIELRKGEIVHVVVAKAAEVTVPNLRGMSQAAARAAIEKAGFVLGDKKVGVDDNAADGVVLRQTPASGVQAAHGSKIDIVVNQ